jgi:GDP-4-dehydro-6-deoxy-D-mannose reductase
VIGSASVLAEAAGISPPPRVVLISSGLVYGEAPAENMPLREDWPARPVSPYAVSKLCSEEIALQAWRSTGLEVVILRPFNYAGPGQSPDFVCSDFAFQIARAEAGASPPVISVGNLEAKRDFADVRDMMDAFVLAAERGVSGSVYNLCSGNAVSIREVLDMLLEQAEVDIEVRQDPGRMRPADVPVFIGDSGLARRELGWRPRRDLERTLADTLDYWRSHFTTLTSADGGPR